MSKFKIMHDCEQNPWNIYMHGGHTVTVWRSPYHFTTGRSTTAAIFPSLSARTKRPVAGTLRKLSIARPGRSSSLNCLPHPFPLYSSIPVVIFTVIAGR